MKERSKKYFLVSLILCAAFSCNRDLKLSLPDPDDKIVIDGWMDSGQYAKVLLTRNTPYLSTIDSATGRSLVLTRAKVTLTDGENSEILILRKNDNYFPPYIFEGNEIVGETGKTYTITAEYGGKTAWAKTTIPEKVNLDTAFFQLEADQDSLGSIYIEFTDPPLIKNYYRILTLIKGIDKHYTSSMVMGIDDIFFSGQKFGFSINRGADSYLTFGKNKYFHLGDTVNIKFCTIDKPHYDFWNSFQEEVLNSGNPFATSLIGIKSNVMGDGLGIWGGYGVSNYILIIK